MKIVYISREVIPSRTDHSIYEMKICNGLAKNGDEVILLSSKLKKLYEKNINDIYKF